MCSCWNRIAQGEWTGGRHRKVWKGDAEPGVGFTPLALKGIPDPPLPPSLLAECLVPTCKVAPWRTMLSRRRTPSPMVTPFPMETLGPSCGEWRDLGIQQVFQSRETDQHLNLVPRSPHGSQQPLPEVGAMAYLPQLMGPL